MSKLKDIWIVDSTGNRRCYDAIQADNIIQQLQTENEELKEELKFFKEHAHPYDIKMWEKGGKE